MTTGTDWQEAVGRNWARSYVQTDRSFAGLTDQLLGRIGGYDGDDVLDVGCGAGELSLAIARARPRARIVGLDVSADLIAVARERAGDRTAVRFELGDAADWQGAGFTPDLIVSRHGVMFFDDPVNAFTHLHGIAGGSANLVFSCFRSPRENHWVTALDEHVGAPPRDLDLPGPFAFADPQKVEAILGAAGWGKIDFEPVDFAYVAGLGEDPIADALAFVSRIGPAAPALKALEGAARAEVEDRLRNLFEAHRSGDIVAFGAAAWIVTANADRRHRIR